METSIATPRTDPELERAKLYHRILRARTTADRAASDAAVATLDAAVTAANLAALEVEYQALGRAA